MATTDTESRTESAPTGGATGGQSSAGGQQDNGQASPFATLKAEAGNLKSTAGQAIRTAASTGKDKAATAIDDVARLIEDAARQIDGRLGDSVGQYARRASTAASNLSMSLKNKEVDDIIDDSKEAIRRNPGMAIGVAAAAGFLISRLIKLGAEADDYSRRGSRDDDRYERRD